MNHVLSYLNYKTQQYNAIMRNIIDTISNLMENINSNHPFFCLHRDKTVQL